MYWIFLFHRTGLPMPSCEMTKWRAEKSEKRREESVRPYKVGLGAHLNLWEFIAL